MNALQEKAIEIALEGHENERSQIYKNVFSTSEGKIFLEDLRNICYAKVSTAMEDSHRTYFNEGMRAVLLHIENQINYESEVKEQENV